MSRPSVHWPHVLQTRGLPAPASLCQVLLGHTTPKGTLLGGQVVLESGKAGPMEGTGQETSVLEAPDGSVG